MENLFKVAHDILSGVTTEEKEAIAESTTEETITEEVNVAEVIAELIDTSWAGSNEEQMKAVQLLKGIALSDDPMSNKFMKALDKFTSGMNKDDYK